MFRLNRVSTAVSGVGAIVVLGVGATLAVGGTENKTQDVRAALSGAKPRNVIFFLGDGMGTQEITAARYYAVGAAGRLNVDRLPFTGFDKTWSVKPDGTTPDYVPDSAATGTEWATGKKTIDDRDSQGPGDPSVPGDNTAYKTVLEYAQESGKKVGDVTTADLTDATPAVLSAHISNRNCSGPDNMTPGPAATPKCVSEGKQNGGLGSIAEQEVDHRMDVALGGGVSRFTQTITGGADAGKTVVQSAQGKGINVVTDAAGLAAADASKPVLGLFGPASGGNSPNMSLEWKGAKATTGAGTAAETCQEDQRPANEPSLSDMTRKSLALLDNPKGFFLQVEGASIDKQDHSANACQQIGETIAFDNAIGVALDYQKTPPDTLIVVTADHAHTSEIVPEDSTGTNLPTGYTNNLTTKDGQVLRMTYGTSGYNGAGNPPLASAPSQQHTGSVVPVWGSGPQAANILGTNDHTDLFDLLRANKADQPDPSPQTTTVTETNTVTQMVPGPVTQGPSVADKTPRLGVAAIRRQTAKLLRSSGLPVSITTLNITSTKVVLRHGSRTAASTTIRGSGTTTLKDKKAKKGTYRLTVTGGGKSVSYTIKIS